MVVRNVMEHKRTLKAISDKQISNDTRMSLILDENNYEKDISYNYKKQIPKDRLTAFSCEWNYGYISK